MLLAISWDTIWSPIPIIIAVAYGITVLFTVLLVILENRDPVKTVSWIMVIMLVPLFGIGFYMVFGQNYRKQKLFSRKGLKDLVRITTLSQKQLNGLENLDSLENEKIREKSRIMMLLLRNSKAILTEWNKVDILNNGQETFDAMLKAIREARDHIHMEFYRWESDQIGLVFRDALVEKAREGVGIRVIFDDVGSWKIGKKYIHSLKAVGIEVYVFMPVKFPFLTSKVNFRNHRKIAVIDGKIGFVGGLNLADKYIHGTRKLGPWYDTHLRIEGQAVRSLQTIFSMDYFFVSKSLLGHQDRYFPDHRPDVKHLVQITACGPDSDWASIMQAYMAAITSAQRYIYICTPYFSPNEAILTALCTMALSGVEVKILLPAKSDSTVAYWNSLSYVSEIMEAGIEVFLFKKGFNHSKLLMVDGIFSSVGTANFDNRSFDLNFEVNALIYNEVITGQLVDLFNAYLKDSRRIRASTWKKRPRKQKIKESLSRILGPLY
jgi:cardiolipin synthase